MLIFRPKKKKTTILLQTQVRYCKICKKEFRKFMYLFIYYVSNLKAFWLGHAVEQILRVTENNIVGIFCKNASWPRLTCCLDSCLEGLRKILKLLSGWLISWSIFEIWAFRTWSRNQFIIIILLKHKWESHNCLRGDKRRGRRRKQNKECYPIIQSLQKFHSP